MNDTGTTSSLTLEEQNQLVTETLDLVDHIVAEVSARYPRHVDRRELWNAGSLGLVEASRRYDPDAGVPFHRYAAIRIRGAIIDSTRTRDWASRSVRRNARDIQQARAGIEQERGSATHEQIAEFLGISETELAKRQAETAAAALLQLDQPTDDEESSTLGDRVQEESGEALPEASIEDRELRGALVEAIENLPDIQAEVMARYYMGGELLGDIAASLDLTEARVSQIRSEAVTSIRAFFAGLYEGVAPAEDAAPGKRARAAYLSRMAEHSTWRTRLDSESEYQRLSRPRSA